jgi:hypothetical protein
VIVGESLRAASALGGILRRHLEMQPARVRAFAGVDGKELPHLLQDVAEVPRLKPVGGGDGVAMHWVAAPDHAATGTALTKAGPQASMKARASVMRSANSLNCVPCGLRCTNSLVQRCTW